ncbi:MAG: cupin domain-containing protein [Actinomycetota bacterium]|nr:cupin domain-containing protein [Actinomycetota bacterium]
MDGDRLHRIRPDECSEATAQTPGMRRVAAVTGAAAGARRIWMGRTHVAPGASSGPHHHGESETAIHVLTGHPVFVYRDGAATERLETEPGDYVYVPPHVPHLEANPGRTEAVIVVARTTQEAIVVNLDSL